jgi:hypothetical protein
LFFFPPKERRKTKNDGGFKADEPKVMVTGSLVVEDHESA